jgi:hypothetical protein
LCYFAINEKELNQLSGELKVYYYFCFCEKLSSLKGSIFKFAIFRFFYKILFSDSCEKEIVNINAGAATICEIAQQSNGITYVKQLLLFGDSNTTIMVNGIYPEEFKYIEKEIRTALLSTIYNTTQNDNPEDAASFTIDISNTDFKVAKYMSGSLLYSTDGKIPTTMPTFIVANSVAKSVVKNKEAFATKRLRQMPNGGQYSIIKTNTITINQLSGIEIIAQNNTNTPELLYQVMLFTKSGDYYLLVGQCKQDIDKYLTTFKKLATTFKRK